MARVKKLDRDGDPATAYATDVVKRKIVAGPHVRAACQRHLDDLRDGPLRGLVWRADKAAEALRFFSGLKLAQGEHAGQPFYPELWQCFVIGSLLGWYRVDGYRRFRTAYIEIGKGNGKTPLAAGLALFGLTADGEMGSEVYCSAVSRDQAKISYRDVKSFVDANPALTRRLTAGLHAIAYPLTQSFLKPLSSEGSTLDGLRVHFGIVDELHEHKTSDVVDKISAGTKGRRQPLIIEITNSGSDRNSVCYLHHDYTIKVVTGLTPDDTWFGYVCALDERDDWMTDPRCWIKANPNLGVSIHSEYLDKQVAEARGMPAKQNIVARLNFCVWTDSVSAWINREKWDAVQVAEVEPDDRDCVAGLDLGALKDLTALSLYFENDNGIGGDARVEFWTPKDTLAQREVTDKAPYELWVREGHLNAVPGSTIDYAYVAKRIAQLRGEVRLKALAFDRWRIKDMLRELSAIGIDAREWEEDSPLEYSEEVLWLRPFGQGFKDMSPAVELIEDDILNRKMRIQRNPVLTWCASGAVLEEDAAGNRKFTKKKATGRIDGIVALTMSRGAGRKPFAESTTQIQQGFVVLS